MTKKIDVLDLGIQIEQLLRSHVAGLRLSVRGAVERAFTPPKAALRAAVRSREQRLPGPRRGVEAIDGLAERFYATVCDRPGETMAHLAPKVGLSGRELLRPVAELVLQ